MSERAPRIDGRMLASALRKVGFVDDGMRGSHLHLWHPGDKRSVTIPVHGKKTVPPGTLAAILRDIEMSVEELRRLV
ncbi:MAG: type II toxin-antitoxin system HicA family toxin [Tepidiformaceae bacterium]